MIRQPTPMAVLYAWHRAALAGEAPPIHEGMPEAGWYRCRLTKGGPWVPVEIRVERVICPDSGELLEPERLVAICDGDRRDPARLWTYLTPISRAEHADLLRRRDLIPSMAATLAPVSTSTLHTMRPR
ncbi:hypothetical protein [Frigidibacter oleivorans]|uniref:hypothetical protein n=1 Tax=Frigidibacter oleivorans TaxID=2487129 RepID=UPI00197ACBFD|nr:hypothetical protein [Frigidibacter oleivorans]